MRRTGVQMSHILPEYTEVVEILEKNMHLMKYLSPSPVNISKKKKGSVFREHRERDDVWNNRCPAF